jgi:ADP-ribose pyrophosphatase YjhB (NUDIX family)
MNIVTCGIIVDQHGDLLVVKRSDTLTWAAPGGNLDLGESPDQGVVREVEEETGFKVLPVRLVRLDYLPIRGGTLQFTFRCLLRGGAVKTSLESTRVGFVKTNPIPVRVLPIHKAPMEGALKHAGGAVEWHRYDLSRLESLGQFALLNLMYPLLDMKRKLFSQIRFQPLQPWKVRVAVVVRNAHGHVRWERSADRAILPSRNVAAGETPWDVAERLTNVPVRDVAGIYTDRAIGELVIVFSADAVANSYHLFHASPPENSDPQHLQFANDAIDPDRLTTIFR